MPLQKLQFRPGLNREGTDYANEGGWYDGDKIRFRSGFPEKIGGWTKYSPSQFLGVARSLWNWEGLTGSFFLGVGTNLKYYVSNTQGGVYNDITPYLDPAGSALTNPFSTTSGSPIVSVTDASYNGQNVGDYVTFTSVSFAAAQTVTITIASPGVLTVPTTALPNGTPVVLSTTGALPTGLTAGTVYYVVGTSLLTFSLAISAGGAAIDTSGTQSGVHTVTPISTVGGLTISGEYTVTAVTGANTYTITASSNATSTATGGGTVEAFYQYPVGASAYSVGTGWGAGPWGGVLSPIIVVLGTDPFNTNGTTTVTVTQTAHGFLTSAGSFTVGVGYKIVALGAGTDWNDIANTIGITYAVGNIFIATKAGSGTGTASIAFVSFSGATDVGGIPAVNLNKSFEITYVDANSYTITSSLATSSTSGGGAAVLATIQSGTQGWGTSFANSNIGAQLRLWSNDNYGQDLVIAPRGGPIYYWEAATGVNTRAQSLASLSLDPTYVPVATNQVLASSIQQFIIALGSNSYVFGDPNTQFNPMLVRWSDQASPFNWIPEVTNQAGEFALTNGSYIMAGRTTRQEILIWTDSCLYSMQYLGAPYVWGFNILMDNISVMSPNSMITINNVTYWMGVEKFYMYSGRVETLPCALRQYIFNDINKTQSFQIFAGSNKGYNEVWWFYCSTNSNVIDKYVIYNYVDQVWYYGTWGILTVNAGTFVIGNQYVITSVGTTDFTLIGASANTIGTSFVATGVGTGTGTASIINGRTAWLDSGINQNPIAADYNGRILNHETSVDDNAGDSTLPITAYVQSSDFDIQDGHNFGFVWRILPDINFNGSTVNNPEVTMTIKPRVNSGTAYGQADNPAVVSGDNYGTSSVYNIQQFTGQVYTRLRGRQLSFRIESTGLGVTWQLGTPRIDIRPDGRR
jgi:hypothetical protein